MLSTDSAGSPRRAANMLLDAFAQGLALALGRGLAGQVEQRQVHQLGDRLADAARRRVRHARQFAEGVAHRVQRQPRDAAAAAEATRHQRVEGNPAFASPCLGSITIRCSTRSGLATA